jgi:hypothetical protein
MFGNVVWCCCAITKNIIGIAIPTNRNHHPAEKPAGNQIRANVDKFDCHGKGTGLFKENHHVIRDVLKSADEMSTINAHAQCESWAAICGMNQDIC